MGSTPRKVSRATLLGIANGGHARRWKQLDLHTLNIGKLRKERSLSPSAEQFAYISDVGAKTFRSQLFTHPGKGGWTFATVPKKYAPPVTEGWGRTPVRASVDGKSWDTSVWWDTKSKKTLLAVPKKIRGAKAHGDSVEVEIEFQQSRPTKR